MAFSFNYLIKSITNNPFLSGNLLSHNYLNELGQNLQDLGNYVGGVTNIVRNQNTNQGLTASFQSLSNWTTREIQDPEGNFVLGNNMIKVLKAGLYTMNYGIEVYKENNLADSSDFATWKNNRVQSRFTARILVKLGAVEVFRAVSNFETVYDPGRIIRNYISSGFVGYLAANTEIYLQAAEVTNGAANTSQTLSGDTFFSIARQG